MMIWVFMGSPVASGNKKCVRSIRTRYVKDRIANGLIPDAHFQDFCMPDKILLHFLLLFRNDRPPWSPVFETLDQLCLSLPATCEEV